MTYSFIPVGAMQGQGMPCPYRESTRFVCK